MKHPGKQRASAIDWPAIRDRLKRAETAAAEALDPTPVRARQILDTRARDLAHAPVPLAPAGSRLNLVVFSLAGESYGVETGFVRQVVRLEQLAPLPGTPDFVAGVSNFRGNVTAIFDIRSFFNLQAKGLTDLSRVVLLGREQVEFGVLADAVHGQSVVTVDEIVAPSSAKSVAGRAYLRGMTKSALIVLNGAALLDDPRLRIEN